MSADRKAALVTGGSAGIGESICRHLLADGYRVFNLSRRPSACQHAGLVDIQVDLADPVATRSAVTELAARHAITTLVHNAGVIRPALIEDVDLGDIDYVTRLHIHAAIVLLQGVLPAMKAAGFGRIVVVGSRAMLGLETRSGYAATKAGQVGLVRTWALELGKYGITANVVAPGPVVTDMFTGIVPEDSDRARRLAQSIPVKRLGQPADVARAVMFLVAAENGFITGQNLFVCGGASLGSVSL
jgi:NAD(P)-dependent dehydrogenase (short-subunit alcohol dehydrogenase family)